MFLTILKIINWFLTEEPSAPIVGEPSTEKTTMNATTEDIVSHIREWSIERVSDKSVTREDARAVLKEFYEWIEPEGNDLEIFSIEEVS